MKTIIINIAAYILTALLLAAIVATSPIWISVIAALWAYDKLF